MKIIIDIDEKYSETEVAIHCRQLDAETEKMIATFVRDGGTVVCRQFYENQ